LSRSVLASALDDEELGWMVGAGDVEEVTQGTLLVEEGRPCERLIILLDGRAELIKRDDNGVDARIAALGPGSMVGELGMMDDEPRPTGARALRDSVLFVLDRATLMDQVDRQGATELKLMRALARLFASRLRGVEDEVVKLLAEQEALLDVLDGILSDPTVLEGRGGPDRNQRRQDLDDFKHKLLAEWNF
jgi:CRP-like cAMP-binding protein